MNSHVKVWKKEDIPKQFHYSNNDRIPPILLMPDDGWFLVNKTDDKIPMSMFFLIDKLHKVRVIANAS